jgi:hypothetical protein
LAFVDRCEDLQALPFALKKYQALREAQPQDELAQKMFQQLWMKSLGRQANHVYEISKMKLLVDKVNWPMVVQVLPWVLFASLFILGISFAAYKNLVGVSVAMAFIYIGIKIFRR